jgi:hypothetical protein
MKHLLIFALLLFARPLNAQILNITAGASNYLGGQQGVMGTLYSANQTTSASIGWGEGHFIASASDVFKWNGYNVTLGDRNIGWSGVGFGLGFSTLGVSIDKTSHDGEDQIMAFAGLTGLGLLTPYYQFVQPSKPGAGFYLRRKLRPGLHVYSLEAVTNVPGQSGEVFTAAEGVTYQFRRTLVASLGAGILTGHKFFTGSLVYKPWEHFTISASHGDQFLPAHATSNYGGANFSDNHLSFSASLNQSTYQGKSLTGESVGAGIRYAWLSEAVSWNQSAGKTIIFSNTTEDFTSTKHFSLSQTITESGNQKSFGFGGSYSSNRFSVSVQHSIVFVYTGGFEQVTGITISGRLHDTTVSAQTLVTPTGQKLWQIFGSDYVQVGDSLPGGGTYSHGTSGKYVISGVVRDGNNEPVYGACVQIGKTVAFSATDGTFEIRENKSASQTFAVVPACFAADGNWEVMSSPDSASPGKPLEIVITRSQSIPIATKPVADAVPAVTPPVKHKSFLKRLWDSMRGRG